MKANANAKFDESVEIAVNLGVDPRHADQNVRGVVTPALGHRPRRARRRHRQGRQGRRSPAAGADIVGAEDLVERIQGGFMAFDRVIATPDMMALVGRLGKVLGPRGLMPNPRVGTVTPNVGQAVKDAKGGAIEFRVEKAGIVHAGIGKASFTEDALLANAKGPAGCAEPRQALRGQGHLREAHQPLVDHGARLQGGNGRLRGVGPGLSIQGSSRTALRRASQSAGEGRAAMLRLRTRRRSLAGRLAEATPWSRL